MRGRAVILDRDGVLTIPHFRSGRSYAPRRLEDFQLYADAAGSVAALKRAGFVVAVATNQPDVGAGLIEPDVIEAMHRRLRDELAIDDIEVCYDTREQAVEDPGERRKPGPGMLIDISRKWNIDLTASYMVGDRDSDMLAGRRVGCTCVFIDRGYTAEPRPTGHAAAVASLDEAARWILGHAAMHVPSCPE